MSVSQDIVRTYRSPRAVVRGKIAAGPREDRALVTLMAACGLIFVSYWPRLARDAHLNAEMEFQGLLANALYGWVFIAPLFFYAFAAIVHIILRFFGGGGSWFGARIAIFWGLFASAPLWLLYGLTSGLADPAAASVVGIVLLGTVLAFWAAGLYEAEFKPSKEAQA